MIRMYFVFESALCQRKRREIATVLILKRIQSKLVFFTGSIQLPARIWSCNVRLHSKPRADKHCSELSYLCGMWGKGSCDKSLLPFCHSSLKRADASGIRSFLTFPFLMQENGLSSSWASSWLTLQEYCDVSSAAPVYSSKAAAPLAAFFERDLRRLHRILGLLTCRCGFCRAGLPYWLHHFCFLVLRDFCPSFPSPFCYPTPVYRRHLSFTNGRKSMDKRVRITLGPLFPLFVKAEMQGI